MEESVRLIKSKVREPQTLAKPKNSDGQTPKISANSLRGDNRFVQMALCQVSDSKKPCFSDNYLIDTSVNKNITITESLNRLRQTGLIDYAVQKQGRINPNQDLDQIPTSKTSLRKKRLESLSRSAEYPIYLSFTPTDLRQKLGENRPHKEAIYYALCDKQPIGSISRKHLLTINQED